EKNGFRPYDKLLAASSAVPLRIELDRLRNTSPTPTVARPAVPSVHQPPIERVAKFTVMVPYDTTPGASPVPLNENLNDPLSSRYSEFYWMAFNGTIPQAIRETKDTGQITVNSTSVSLNDSIDFLARLLQ